MVVPLIIRGVRSGCSFNYLRCEKWLFLSLIFVELLTVIVLTFTMLEKYK